MVPTLTSRNRAALCLDETGFLSRVKIIVMTVLRLSGLYLASFISLLYSTPSHSQSVPAPPQPEPIEINELPLPPVAPSNDTGACTADINPRGTGCIGKVFDEFQAGDFTPDGEHVVVNVWFVGAPAGDDDPARIYDGEHLIAVKTDGGKFSNGDPWKCLTCGIPAENAVSLDPERDYPHVFRSGEKVLWGHNIIECGGEQVASEDCTPDKTFIYPIYWPDDSGAGGVPREMRLHPDDVHMGWSSFTNTGGQFGYFGRLEFNESPETGELKAPRYDLVDVNLLVRPGEEGLFIVNGTELQLNDDAITVGELRGFSGSGDEILYIGAPRESNNIDIFAVHIETGAVRRLTSHPEYTDPVAFSADNEWFVAMDTRGSDRQMWMAGMRHIPPLNDIVSVSVSSSTRNNGPRRFFQPILIDRYGDRGEYFGQTVNAEGDGKPGSVNDPNWNGRADPAFSPDSTRIVYWQALVIPPSCGGDNPLPCPDSTAPGGRTYRVMLANLHSRKPAEPAKVFNPPDVIPWATKYEAGMELPEMKIGPPPGNYTLRGRVSGVASVSFSPGDGAVAGLGLTGTVSVVYDNYADVEGYVLDGSEEVSVLVTEDNPWNNYIDWYSDIVQTGKVEGTKLTSDDGFHLEIDVMVNIFNANGTLTTTLDGTVYKQPENGT